MNEVNVLVVVLFNTYMKTDDCHAGDDNYCWFVYITLYTTNMLVLGEGQIPETLFCPSICYILPLYMRAQKGSSE